MNDTNRAPCIGVFLVGGYKCGTTIVSGWLFQHPHITSCREYPVFRDRFDLTPETKQLAHEVFHYTIRLQIQPGRVSQGTVGPDMVVMMPPGIDNVTHPN